VPRGHDHRPKYPVVILLHGMNQDTDEMERLTGSTSWLTKTASSGLSWLDYLQSFYPREVPFVECGHLASTFEGSRRHDQVVRTDHFAHRL